jgi:hypothetical protein
VPGRRNAGRPTSRPQGCVGKLPAIDFKLAVHVLHFT